MEEQMDLKMLFPNMKPVKGPPPLFTINGIGLSIYGNRDHHQATQTYVKTHVITFVFLPIIALGAYRVMDAEGGGWYFLGKVPLSTFAKTWNRFLVFASLVLASVSFWNVYVSSPKYLAQRRLSKAKKLQRSGKHTLAAFIYRSVYEGNSSLKDEARQGLKTSLNRLPSMPAKEAAGVLKVVVDLQTRTKNRTIAPKIHIRGMHLVHKYSQDDPYGALEILNAITPAVPVKDRKVLKITRRRLLKWCLSKDPNDINILSQLALLYEREKKYQKCIKLLLPHIKRLGSSEGARILGQILARRGQYNASHDLLLPYTKKHLRVFHQAEKNHQKAKRVAYKQAIRNYRRRRGPKKLYTRAFKKLSRSQKSAMINAYLQQQMRDNWQLKQSRKALRKTTHIVPVAMDLGIAKLYRSRTLQSPIRKRQELKAAEKLFLSIRGVVGQRDQYKLYLSQVYYWLGQQAKGRLLLDQILKKSRRSPTKLLMVARVIRSLGDMSQARKLTEEAYRTAKKEPVKFSAALLRAMSYTNINDRLLWLRRANPADPHIIVALNGALGNQAKRDGNYAKASKYLRKSIKGYKKLPQDSSNLNNCALVYLSLFRVTGRRVDFQKAIELMEKAVSLKPSNSILLNNTATTMLQGVVLELLGEDFDIRHIQGNVQLSMLSFLYKDKKGQTATRKRLFAQKLTQKVINSLNKVLVLAPKNINPYIELSSLHWQQRSIPNMKKLLERFQSSKPSIQGKIRAAKALLQGKKDLYYQNIYPKIIKQNLKDLQNAMNSRSSLNIAIAANAFISNSMTASQFGVRASPNKVVNMARRAYRKHPSSKTQYTLARSYLFRAGERFVQQEQIYRQFYQKRKRQFSHLYLLAHFLNQEGELRQKLIKDPDIQKALTLVLSYYKAYQSHPNSWEWMLLKSRYPSTGDKIAQQIQEDKLSHYYQSLQMKMYPLHPTVHLMGYWNAKAMGKTQLAEELQRKAKRLGILIPLEQQL